MEYSELVDGKQYIVKNLYGKKVVATWKRFDATSGQWQLEGGFLLPTDVDKKDIEELESSAYCPQLMLIS